MTRRRSIGLSLADDLGGVRTVTVEAEVSHQGWEVRASDANGRLVGSPRLVATQAMVAETVLDILRPLLAASFAAASHRPFERSDQPAGNR